MTLCLYPVVSAALPEGLTTRVEHNVAADGAQPLLVRALLAPRRHVLRDGFLGSARLPGRIAEARKVAASPVVPTLQSMHLPPNVLTLPRSAPGLAYGAAFARALSSLFSPSLRIAPDPALNGSDVATVDVFCCQRTGKRRQLRGTYLLALLAHHRRFSGEGDGGRTTLGRRGRVGER